MHKKFDKFYKNYISHKMNFLLFARRKRALRFGIGSRHSQAALYIGEYFIG